MCEPIVFVTLYKYFNRFQSVEYQSIASGFSPLKSTVRIFTSGRRFVCDKPFTLPNRQDKPFTYFFDCIVYIVLDSQNYFNTHMRIKLLFPVYYPWTDWYSRMEFDAPKHKSPAALRARNYIPRLPRTVRFSYFTVFCNESTGHQRVLCMCLISRQSCFWNNNVTRKRFPAQQDNGLNMHSTKMWYTQI